MTNITPLDFSLHRAGLKVNLPGTQIHPHIESKASSTPIDSNLHTAGLKVKVQALV